MKKARKFLSVIMSVVFAFSMMLPIGAAPAVAGGTGTISALSTPTVKDNSAQALGTIKVVVPAGTLKDGDKVNVKLPSDFDFNTSVYGDVYVGATDTIAATNKNHVYAPAMINASDANDIACANGLSVNVINSDDEIQLTADTAQDVSLDLVFYIYLGDIEIESGANADCLVTLDGPSDTGFPTGTVLVGKSSTDGTVSLTTSSKDTSNNDFDVDLRIKENVAGSMDEDTSSIKLELPDGYKWDTAAVAGATYSKLWGEEATFTTSTDDETLKISFTSIANDANDDNNETDKASCWELKGLKFYVDDDSDVTAGTIMAKVSGETDSDVSEVEVGTYGEYKSGVSAKEVTTLVSGQNEQEIGNVLVKEEMEGSLIENRTVTLTLPEGARWQKAYEAQSLSTPADPNKDPAYQLPDFDVDKSLHLTFDKYMGNDYRTAKFTVSVQSTDDEAEAELKDVEVALEAGFTGNLDVEVGGTAGLTDTITVAKVENAVTASSDKVSSVVIGGAGQEAGTLTLTEKVAGALLDEDDNNATAKVVLDLPGGVTFDGTPEVEVTTGDLKVKSVKTINGNNQVEFQIDKTSDTPSTITVSGIKLKVDRTVVEGNINVKVQGTAVVETSNLNDWSASDTAAKTAIATVVTAADSATTIFNVGSSIYTVSGVTKVMDAAPYIKNARTYVPVRYLAYALGVNESDIAYENNVVTLTKGDTTIQLTIGSKTLSVNGTATSMDVAPEVVSGRTMLPARFVAEALGSVVGYAGGQVVISK